MGEMLNDRKPVTNQLGSAMNLSSPMTSNCGLPKCVSDVDLLGNLDGIVDLDAKVANRALDLRMSERLGFIVHLRLTH